MGKHRLFPCFCLILFFMARGLCAQSDSATANADSDNKETSWALSIMNPNFLIGNIAFVVFIDGNKAALLPNYSHVTLKIEKPEVTLKIVVEHYEVSVSRIVNPLDAYLKVDPSFSGLAITRGTKE